MTKKTPKLTLKCECAPKKLQSGKCKPIEVYDMGNGVIELEGACLKKSAVQKLVKFLLKSLDILKVVDIK